MLTSEDQLILLLARGTAMPPVQERALALLSTPLNWELILERVMAQEVYPLFHRNLGALGGWGAGSKEQGAKGEERKLPSPGSMLRAPCYEKARSEQEAREQLRKLSKINAFRNTLLKEELVRVLTRLGDAGIPTIPLKGVALAESLYGNTGARVCGDIDILVTRRSVCQAFSVLLAAGFEAYDQKVEACDIDMLLDSNMEYAFVRRSGGMMFLVELHWDIAWRWGKNSTVIDDLWTEVRRKSYWETEAYALSAEWDLLYLAVHAAHHQWQSLKWLVDIHEMCARSDIDWQKLQAKAKRLGLEKMLKLTLAACHQLFNTVVPPNLSLTKTPYWMKIFPAAPAPMNVWRANFFPARLFAGPGQKMRYLARLALVPT